MELIEHDGRLCDYARKQIEYHTRRMIGRYGFTRTDEEDIAQELSIYLLEQMKNFDPARSKPQTFIQRILKHRIVDLIRYQKAGQRHYRRNQYSLDEQITNADGKQIPRSQTMDLQKSPGWAGRALAPTPEQQDLFIDLHEALKSLPPELRQLWERLKVQSVSEISRQDKVSRARIYQRRAKIKRILTPKGLAKYFEKNSDS